MKKLAAVGWLAAVLWLTPCLFAQHEEAHESASHEQHAENAGPHPLWKWANFAILAGVLGYFIAKRSGAFFAERGRQIRQAMEDSARLKKEAQERIAAVEARLTNLAHEIDGLRDESRHEMEAEIDRVRQETQEQLRKIQLHAEQEIASAGKAARQELKAYSVELAVGMAEQKIRSRLTPDIEKSLIGSFVSDLEQQSPAQRAGEQG